MYDYAVIGGGLAGASIASRLSRNNSVLLVHSESPGMEGSATEAGLVNPIMTRQGARVWNAEGALSSFQKLVQESAASEFVKMAGVYRPASTEKQAVSFQEVARQYPHLCSWMGPDAWSSRFREVRAPLGGIYVSAGGAVDIPGYVGLLHNVARDNGCTLVRDRAVGLNDDDASCHIRLESGREFAARTVVLAVGAGYSSFSQLRKLNVHRIKGQTVTIRKPEGMGRLPLLSGSGYLVDNGSTLLAGSSYEHEFSDNEVDQGVLEKLVEKASKMVPGLEGAEIIRGHAGVRVTVPKSYLPMVGPVDQAGNVWVVTGLGSKGILMSAWIADRFEAFVKGDELVPTELSVQFALDDVH